MTEDQIERSAEREMDILDRLFLSGRLTQEQYDREVRELNEWCEEEYLAHYGKRR